MKRRRRTLSFSEKVSMYGFFLNNIDNTDKLVKYYNANEAKINTLKLEYPDWEDYVQQYPELTKELRNRGVPL